MYTYETLIDSYYDEWSEHDWNYADMIRCARDRNPLHALAILVATYNEQVCNGGHQQYFDNGYADGNNGVFRDHPTIDMHDLMISLFTQLNLASDKRFAAAVTIMNMFKEDWDNNEDCYKRDGTGYIDGPAIDRYLADELDDLYYAICDQFIKDFKETINARLQEDTL